MQLIAEVERKLKILVAQGIVCPRGGQGQSMRRPAQLLQQGLAQGSASCGQDGHD
ncbi:MAG: hypothetical protein WKF40_00615 [Thermoleophilaceae bacterium]